MMVQEMKTREVKRGRARNAPGTRLKHTHTTQKSRGGSGGQNVIPRVRQRDATSIQELWAPVFPARTMRRLRYSTYFNLSTTAGAVASYVFSANGLFDPDVTGTGHQPMGFDQLMLSYNHYVVKAAHIVCTAKNTTTSNPVVCVSVQPGSTPITVIDTLLEYGLNNRETLEFKGVNGSVKVLEASCDIRKVQGVQDVLDVTDLQGTAAANPVEQSYFIVQTWDTAGVNGSITVDVVIEYEAWFSEPRVLTPSMRQMLSALVVSDDKKATGQAWK